MTDETLRRIRISGGGGEEEAIRLTAGKLVAEFAHGILRSVRVGGVEVVQQIYMAVRDRDWNTLPLALSNMRHEQSGNSFVLRFGAVNKLDGDVFEWEGRIEGYSDSRITYSFDGRVKRDFLRNRIGFCCLHPMHAAGVNCVLTHCDGSEETTAFPVDVAPHQPFTSVMRMSHRAAGGTLTIDFSGDEFETEDQRNWTDSSFKTYCTPLARPFPVLVKAGERICQSITLAYREGASPVRLPGHSVREKQATGRLPLLGVRVSEGESWEECEEVLSLLRPDFVRMDWSFSGDNDIAGLDTKISDVARTGTKVLLALSCHPSKIDAIAGQLASVLKKHAVNMYGVLFVPPPAFLSQYSCMTSLFSVVPKGIRVGVGVDSNFAELNRNRPYMRGIDFISFAANPQVHVFDNHSIIENIPGLGAASRSAGKIAGETDLMVGPLTLRPTFNPVATSGGEADIGGIPYPVDVRQQSLFAASWLAASCLEMAESGVDSAVVFNAVTGWEGLRERLAGPPLPEKFPSRPGQFFPVFHLLRFLLRMCGGEAQRLSRIMNTAASGFTIRKKGDFLAIIFNCSNQSECVPLSEALDAGTYALFMLSVDEYDHFAFDADWGVNCKGHCEHTASLLVEPYSVVVLQKKAI